MMSNKSIYKVDKFGTKSYWLNGSLHREDGPAIERADGSKEWFINDERHREDGPAVEYCDGDTTWFYHGKWVNCKDNEEFLRMIRLMVFL